MATTSPQEFSSDFEIGPKTAQAIYYVLIGLLAMGIAIPAAIMTADIGLFEECYAAAEVCAAR